MQSELKWRIEPFNHLIVTMNKLNWRTRIPGLGLSGITSGVSIKSENIYILKGIKSKLASYGYGLDHNGKLFDYNGFTLEIKCDTKTHRKELSEDESNIKAVIDTYISTNRKALEIYYKGLSVLIKHGMNLSSMISPEEAVFQNIYTSDEQAMRFSKDVLVDGNDPFSLDPIIDTLQDMNTSLRGVMYSSYSDDADQLDAAADIGRISIAIAAIKDLQKEAQQ